MDCLSSPVLSEQNPRGESELILFQICDWFLLLMLHCQHFTWSSD